MTSLFLLASVEVRDKFPRYSELSQLTDITVNKSKMYEIEINGFYYCNEYLSLKLHKLLSTVNGVNLNLYHILVDAQGEYTICE